MTPNRVHWEAVARDEPADWAGLATEPAGVAYEWVEDPAGLRLHPAVAVSGPALLAVHGGGFVSGSTGTHRRMFGHLARDSGVRTFAVEYGLVPQHVFPSQLDTVTIAYGWLVVRATAVAVTGDSCGAGLAVALAVRLRDLGLARPASLLLLSTWADLDATGGSYDSDSDPFFTRDVVRALGRGYLAGADPRDPLAAPAHAAVHGLPPSYLRSVLRSHCSPTATACSAPGTTPDAVQETYLRAHRAARRGGLEAAVTTWTGSDSDALSPDRVEAAGR